MKLSQEQKDALAQLYRETYYGLSSYARSSLRSKALVEEAVQETFLIACSRPEKVLNSPNPTGWLVLALRYAMQGIQARERKFALEPYHADQTDAAELQLDPKLLYDSYLTNEEFELLRRVTVDGYTLMEAAEELGLSMEACKKRAQRAKKKFREKYFQDI